MQKTNAGTNAGASNKLFFHVISVVFILLTHLLELLSFLWVPLRSCVYIIFYINTRVPAAAILYACLPEIQTSETDIATLDQCAVSIWSISLCLNGLGGEHGLNSGRILILINEVFVNNAI